MMIESKEVCDALMPYVRQRIESNIKFMKSQAACGNEGARELLGFLPAWLDVVEHSDRFSRSQKALCAMSVVLPPLFEKRYPR